LVTLIVVGVVVTCAFGVVVVRRNLSSPVDLTYRAEGDRARVLTCGREDHEARTQEDLNTVYAYLADTKPTLNPYHIRKMHWYLDRGGPDSEFGRRFGMPLLRDWDLEILISEYDDENRVVVVAKYEYFEQDGIGYLKSPKGSQVVVAPERDIWGDLKK
jgi:hypothetical protein